MDMKPVLIAALALALLASAGCGAAVPRALGSTVPIPASPPMATTTPDSTATPEPGPTNPPATPATATVLVVGDIMCHSPQYKAVAGVGYRFDSAFAPVKGLVSGADLAIGNLETTLAKRGWSGYPAFRSPATLADSLARTGFDVLTTANNHALDGGKSGLAYTVSRIKAQKMSTTGTAKQPAVVREANGLRIGILAYTYGTNGIRSPYAGAVNRINEKRILADIKALHGKTDAVIVFLHWGTEYHRKPIAAQKSLGRHLLDGGASIVVGSHPHVAEGVEKYRGKYIVYSMGNFISGQVAPYTDMGYMTAFTLTRDASGTVAVSGLRAVPVYRDHNSGGGSKSYRVLLLGFRDRLVGKADRSAMAKYAAYSKELLGSYSDPDFAWPTP